MPPAAAGLAAEFDRAMAAFAPFEPAPRLAVAVSGGADSMALCLLADRWARAEGGGVTALIVDHRLRPASAAEAIQVGRWLDRRSIAHRCLVWEGEKPATGIQAAARAARYRLLIGWCREAGVDHLLVGHQASDQAETVLMRIGRASGLVGLAGMLPLTEPVRPKADGGHPAPRLLRPLLEVPPERLRPFLRAQGQPWLDDPSNRDPRFDRVRLRRAAASLAAAGVDRAALLHLARLARTAREATEAAVDALLAASVVLHPAGFARIETPLWGEAARFILVRAAARLLRIVGGRRWQAPDQRIERLMTVLLDQGGSAATLGGCRLRRTADGVLVWREERGLPAPLPVAGGEEVEVVWDRRFVVRITPGGQERSDLALEALGAARARTLSAAMAEGAFGSPDVPLIVWPTLPCVVDGRGLALVPHLGYRRADAAGQIRATAYPQQGLSGRGSFLV